jgi:hypothetical protein
LKEEGLGELNYEVPATQNACAQDLVKDADKELLARKELTLEFERLRSAAKR